MKRIFLIVLDSCGIGAGPDAADFGDVGSNTLRACAASPEFDMRNLISYGLGNLDGVDCLPKSAQPKAALRENGIGRHSEGKDAEGGAVLRRLEGCVEPQYLRRLLPAHAADGRRLHTEDLFQLQVRGRKGIQGHGALTNNRICPQGQLLFCKERNRYETGDPLR